MADCEYSPKFNDGPGFREVCRECGEVMKANYLSNFNSIKALHAVTHELQKYKYSVSQNPPKEYHTEAHLTKYDTLPLSNYDKELLAGMKITV